MERPTRYDPKDHEADIYAAWEESGGFAPRPVVEGDDGGRGTFMIAIPPPNVTGVLHMGHALNNTIQDIVSRHRRMSGYQVLWLPGTDHAGIATQAVVERKLYQEEKKTREDMGREAFLAEIWNWKEQYGGKILEQLRSLGSSCDWGRTAFTMDESLSRAVREAFCRLFEKGLVYRGARLVNWDCVLKTAVSDDEIDYATRKGKLWHLRYPLEGKPGEFLVVATTRPETMLGDTGVAVHPEDERYKELVGTNCVLPFLDRKIPIVADDTVDPGFGSGAVKITPGHDPADYERGKRHKLPIINLLEKDGKLNENGGPFAGMPREEARKAVVKGLEELELLETIEDITHNVALSDRSKSPIEPLVSEQWFVKMQPLAKPAIQAAKSKDLQFVPERWEKVYLDWLENVHDWCISRQLWWGHRIPVWYDEDGTPAASREDLEIGSAHPTTGKPIVSQDPDVLDTWASSWLWPFATLGWPDKTPDLERFYPTQFLSTARDIIYLWVARMVMAGYEFLDHLPMEKRLPFSVVNVHATVLDAKGQRMSKSRGNGIDPLDMIDQYGADAVRFSLMLLTKQGQDVKLAPDKFDQGYRFGNKVWNAARFVLMNLEGERTGGTLAEAARLEDRWILGRLAATIESVDRSLNDYLFNDAAMTLYRFIWNDFCDWYLEIVKSRIQDGGDESGPAARGTLARVLKDTLAMLHPFTPYLTEVLWEDLHSTLGEDNPGMLMNCAWPTGEGLSVDETSGAEMATIQDLVHAVRQVRMLTMIGERKPLECIVRTEQAHELEVLENHGPTIRALAFLESYRIDAAAERPPGTAVAVAGGMEAIVFLGDEVDTARLGEVLAGRVTKTQKGIEGIDKKLSNERFLQNADAALVEKERARREELAVELQLLESNLAGLS